VNSQRAGAGLVLLWRSGWRAEAALCSVIVVLFVLLDAGYFRSVRG
jgi:hypothetical protein